MKCPNCGQSFPEGARLCPSCGTVLTSAAPGGQAPVPLGPAPAIVPLAPPPGLPGPAAATPTPGSSAPAKASLWLGIGSLVFLVLVIGATFVALAVWISSLPAELVTELQESPDRIQQWLEDPQQQDAMMTVGAISLGAMGCSFLAEIAAVVGLILGVLGLSRERKQPTEHGRTHSIVGIVFSILPMLCCAGGLVVQLLSISGV